MILLALLAASLALYACAGGVSPPPDAPVGPLDVRADAATEPAAASSDASAVDDLLDVAPEPSTDAGGSRCSIPPICAGAPDSSAPPASFRHPVRASLTVASGPARHRGRDLVLARDEPQWALAKFAYGPLDDDLKDEEVDVWLMRGCQSWEHLATVLTTEDDAHEPVLGVTDTGGWAFLEIPTERRLSPGWHRLHFVVRADLTTAEQWILVLDAPAAWAVTDVDGTLTESETAEWRAVFDAGAEIATHPGAPEALWALAAAGYTIVYLTARPDWLATRTRDWLASRGFPPGLVRTTLAFAGAVGDAAVTYKSEALTDLSAHFGTTPGFAIGNTASDAEAYRAAGTAPDRRLLFDFSGDSAGGRAFGDYRDLARELGARSATDCGR